MFFVCLFALLDSDEPHRARPTSPFVEAHETRFLSHDSYVGIGPETHTAIYPCYTPAIRHTTQPSLPWRRRCLLAPLETHTPDEGGQLLDWRPKHVPIFPDAMLSIGSRQAGVLREAPEFTAEKSSAPGKGLGQGLQRQGTWGQEGQVTSVASVRSHMKSLTRRHLCLWQWAAPTWGRSLGRESLVSAVSRLVRYCRRRRGAAKERS